MKRIIYVLLYENGQFIQSRNFRRQQVGDINWLLNNYDFPRVSLNLDELMIINISSTDFDHSEFFNVVLKIAQKSFIPLTIGGRINSIEDAERCYAHGADKIFVNTLLRECPPEVIKIKNYLAHRLSLLVLITAFIKRNAYLRIVEANSIFLLI